MTGGAVAALVALPEAMAYGALVFGAVSPALAAQGALAGLFALVVIGLGSWLLGSAPTLMSGPYSMASLTLAAAAPAVVAPGGPLGATEPGPELAIAVLLGAAVVAGLLQAAGGALGVGRLAQFIPYPVLAGLLTGTALLIIWGQARPLLGLEPTASLLDLSAVRPATVLVSGSTIVLAWIGLRLRGPSAPLVATGFGIGLFHLLRSFGVDAGATLGQLPEGGPGVWVAQAWLSLAPAQGQAALVALLPVAGALAIVLSIQTLVAGLSADEVTRARHDPNRELLAHGLANALGAAAGALPSAGSQSRTIAGHQLGARTRHSQLAGALMVALLLFLLRGTLSWVPRSVLSALLVVAALGIFDRWTIGQVRAAFTTSGKERGTAAVNVAQVALVTTTLLFSGVITAVALGVVLAAATFVLRMGKRSVRRDYSGRRTRARVFRPQREDEVLDREGHRIRCFELEGSLFFGTADRVARQVERYITSDVGAVLLDFEHVTDLDATGARVLSQLHERCRERQVVMALSGFDSHRPVGRALAASGVLRQVPQAQQFPEGIEALAWAEDQLLDRVLGAERYQVEIGMGAVDSLADLGKASLERVGRLLERLDYRRGEIVFRQGDPSDGVYFLTRGRVSVHAEGTHVERWLSVLCPGTSLGEVALLDGRPRSATARALDELTCLRLGDDRFEELKVRHPETAIALLAGFGRELARRERSATRNRRSDF